MAADHALRRELSRRIRDDLISLGIVAPGPAVTIGGGARASCGDLIICTRNDHAVEAGEPGRTLANGDLLRIDAITKDGLLVRRALDADPRTGHRRWTDRRFLFAGYNNSELGYAVTDHAAQGRTVTAGLAVITGNEDRQHVYVTLTRGTEVNTAYVFTQSPKQADPAPGPRPAPELARYGRLTTAPGGQPAPARSADALTVLVGVLDRDGQQHSATQARDQALSDADHLALLHAIWAAETTPARHQRYKDLLMAALPPGYRREPGHQARWLWRTLRAAELAGLDPARLLAEAIAKRDLAGARDIAAVPDARLRHRVGSLVPLPAVPWSARVPALPDPDRRAYPAQLAALMDARTQRIGEHAAENALPWATAALGSVPAHPAARLEWQKRAAAIGAYRELSGYDHPSDPIGPEPAAADPDKRAAWYQALAALGPADSSDVRGMPDGRLLHLRDTYTVETAWAPRYVGDQLQQVRAAGWQARLSGLRAAADSAAAARRGDHDQARSKQALAASYLALQQAYRQREDIFAAVMADRADWEQATRAQRHPAIAADAELRRRHPGQYHPPLRSAEPEPEPVAGAQRDDLTLTAGERPAETGQWINDLAAEHREFAHKLADRQSITIPSPDPDHVDLGQAFPPWPAPARGAILQPPRPEIPPSPQILQRAMDRDTDWEAAD